MAPNGSKPGRKLTLKEQRFVDALLGSAKGNATQAARMAGYKDGPAIRQTARENLTKPHIIATIEARQQRGKEKGIASAEERDLRLSQLMRDSEDEKVVVSAVKELNKCHGRHSIKHVLEGKLTLEQALEDSHQ